MNTFGKAVVLSMGLLASSVALAECPTELPFDNLMDCMVEEGAGGEYPVERVLQELNKQQSEGKQTMSIDDGRTADDVS